jgi:hypothetical protein
MSQFQALGLRELDSAQGCELWIDIDAASKHNPEHYVRPNVRWRSNGHREGRRQRDKLRGQGFVAWGSRASVGGRLRDSERILCRRWLERV